MPKSDACLGDRMLVVTGGGDVPRWMPRTVTIRDGRIGGEGRSGEEFAVVTVDGVLPLPLHPLDHLPPRPLVRFHGVDGVYTLLAEQENAPGRRRGGSMEEAT